MGSKSNLGFAQERDRNGNSPKIPGFVMSFLWLNAFVLEICTFWGTHIVPPNERQVIFPHFPTMLMICCAIFSGNNRINDRFVCILV